MVQLLTTQRIFPAAAAHAARTPDALRCRRDRARLRAALARPSAPGFDGAALRRELGLRAPRRMAAQVARAEAALYLRESVLGRVLAGSGRAAFGTLQLRDPLHGCGVGTVLACAPALIAGIAGGLLGLGYGLVEATALHPLAPPGTRYTDAVGQRMRDCGIASAVMLGATVATFITVPLLNLCAALGVLLLLPLDLMAAAYGAAAWCRRPGRADTTDVAVNAAFVTDDGARSFDAPALAQRLLDHTRRADAPAAGAAAPAERAWDGARWADVALSAPELARLIRHGAVPDADRAALARAALGLAVGGAAAPAPQVRPAAPTSSALGVSAARSQTALGVDAEAYAARQCATLSAQPAWTAALPPGGSLEPKLELERAGDTTRGFAAWRGRDAEGHTTDAVAAFASRIEADETGEAAGFGVLRVAGVVGGRSITFGMRNSISFESRLIGRDEPRLPALAATPE